MDALEYYEGSQKKTQVTVKGILLDPFMQCICAFLIITHFKSMTRFMWMQYTTNTYTTFQPTLVGFGWAIHGTLIQTLTFKYEDFIMVREQKLKNLVL